jgi:hypothetical protein
MAISGIRLMLARRPEKETQAFGHLKVSEEGRKQLGAIVAASTSWAESQDRIDYHPDDRPDGGEVLSRPLAGFDDLFQAQAPWSLERLVKAARATGVPLTLTKNQISDGLWTFYAFRALIDGKDVVQVRRMSPTYGLDPSAKLFTMVVGNQVKPVNSPLLSFEDHADVLIIDDNVYVISPERAEALFVDSSAIKARAPHIASNFRSKLKAGISADTANAIERVCSHDSRLGRKVERLIQGGGLAKVTAPAVRLALPDAGLESDAFGMAGPLKAESDERARTLIDIAADLFYQPRFEKTSRRVGSYRRVT